MLEAQEVGHETAVQQAGLPREAVEGRAGGSCAVRARVVETGVAEVPVVAYGCGEEEGEVEGCSHYDAESGVGVEYWAGFFVDSRAGCQEVDLACSKVCGRGGSDSAVEDMEGVGASGKDVFVDGKPDLWRDLEEVTSGFDRIRHCYGASGVWMC